MSAIYLLFCKKLISDSINYLASKKISPENHCVLQYHWETRCQSCTVTTTSLMDFSEGQGTREKAFWLESRVECACCRKVQQYLALGLVGMQISPKPRHIQYLHRASQDWRDFCTEKIVLAGFLVKIDQGFTISGAFDVKHMAQNQFCFNVIS